MEVLTSRTIIRPSDLERSLDFYTRGLGLAIAREFGEGTHRGVVFFVGGGLLEVVGGGSPPMARDRDSGIPPVSTGPVVLWLQVRAIDQVVAELSARRVAVVRPPMLEAWGLIEAWIDDPDGLRIHLVEVPAEHPLRRDERNVLQEAEPSS